MMRDTRKGLPRALADYLERIAGARVAIAASPENGFLPAYVGGRESLMGHGVDDLPWPKEGFDGYSVQLTPTRLVIAGENSRGTLYGVYDFLERCGCRWYYPQFDPNDPEIVPRRETLSLEPFEVSCAAQKWGFRRPFFARFRVDKKGARDYRSQEGRVTHRNEGMGCRQGGGGAQGRGFFRTILD